MNNQPNYNSQNEKSAFLADSSAVLIDPVVIPVIEEQLQVDKQVIETGIVRITKQVIEEPETVAIPVFREEVIVDHVAVYQYVDTAPVVRYEGETMIIPVVREVLVTEKKLLLVEEVHVTKKQTTDQERVDVMLRKEKITVERINPSDERSAETTPSL